MIDRTNRTHQMNHMHEIMAAQLPERQVNLNPVQWAQALGMARKLCSDIFQEGGSPVDAVSAYGTIDNDRHVDHWGQAINMIAFSIYAPRRQSLH